MYYIMLNAVCNIVLGDYKSLIIFSQKGSSHSLLILEFHFLIKENIYLQKYFPYTRVLVIGLKNSSYKKTSNVQEKMSLYNCRLMRLNFHSTLNHIEHFKNSMLKIKAN